MRRSLLLAIGIFLTGPGLLHAAVAFNLDPHDVNGGGRLALGTEYALLHATAQSGGAGFSASASYEATFGFIPPLLVRGAAPTVPRPRVVASVYSDDNDNGVVESGERVTLIMSDSVTVSPGLMPSTFYLPVSGDTLGGGGPFLVAVNPLNSRRIDIVLGTGASLTVPLTFDIGNTGAGQPSGIDIAAGLPTTAIRNLSGIPATDRGVVGMDDAGVDIVFAMKTNSAVIGAGGGSVSVVSTPDAAYTAHTLSIPAGALASDVTFTLQPPPVSLGVIGAVQVDGSTPGVSFTIPATLTLEYLDSDVDSGLGQVEGAMQVSQLVETSPASFEWISLGGAQAVDRVNNLVTFQMSDIDPFPSSGPPGIFAAIPAETIERVVGFIKPSGTGAAAVVTNGTGGATLGVGAGGYYSQHRLEFPGYENTSLFDPERITVIIQTASLFERESLVGGNSFPTGSGAIMAIETRNASGELIAFTDPFNIRVEFKPSDQIDFSGFPRPGAPLVLVKDVLSDAQVDFQPVGAVGTSSSIVDVSGARVLEVTSISDLTGAAGRGAWGLVAYDDPMPTPIPLSLWEFAPDITVPIGTGAGSFPGDAALTETRTPDEDLDSFGTDLAIGTTNLGTAQAFAHWDSPPDLIPFDDGATHRVIWRIAASGFADPANIPQIRLRANYGFTGGLGATDVVVPETAVAAPTINGETTYELIFDELEVASANGTTIVNLGTPFDGLTSTENAKRLFFDWVDFEGAPAPLGGGTLELESVIIQRLDKVNLLALSANERTITDFTQGVSVDQFGGAIDTSPGSSISVSFAPAGAMISSSGTNTTGSFQLWNALSLQLDVGGVAALPFAPSNPTEARIYRAEVGLAGLSGSPDVPQLRVIINGFDSGTAVNTLSTEFLINAVRGNVEGDSTFNPAIGAMEFSAYLALPSNQPTFGGTVGDRIQASLTLVDQDTPYVSGGSVTINRIQIDSIPVSVLP